MVAFGTSATELAVTIHAGLANQADIAVGNVIGSCIFNVLFILGISALVRPLLVSRQLIRRDVPIMIGVSILALVHGRRTGASAGGMAWLCSAGSCFTHVAPSTPAVGNASNWLRLAVIRHPINQHPAPKPGSRSPSSCWLWPGWWCWSWGPECW